MSLAISRCSRADVLGRTARVIAPLRRWRHFVFRVSIGARGLMLTSVAHCDRLRHLLQIVWFT